MNAIHPLQLFDSVKSRILPRNRLNSLTNLIYNREHLQKKQKSNLICCSDYTIRKLNREYRSKDKVTDVLSFAFNEADLLGEIYISIRRTEIQARRYNVTFDDEFLRLFIHGLLHLTGYDHILSQERILMEKREHFYLSQITIHYGHLD
jgi:probable rRNA maturation factor